MLDETAIPAKWKLVIRSTETSLILLSNFFRKYRKHCQALAAYTWIELLWRGHTHWTMFILGGLCFVIMGLLNEHIFPWELSLLWQSMISAVIISAFEFATGCIVNLWLGWNVWNYSDMSLNLCGQICLPFTLLWILLSVAGIIADDWIRYWIYLFVSKFFPMIYMEKRQKPTYKLL